MSCMTSSGSGWGAVAMDLGSSARSNSHIAPAGHISRPICVIIPLLFPGSSRESRFQFRTEKHGKHLLNVKNEINFKKNSQGQDNQLGLCHNRQIKMKLHD